MPDTKGVIRRPRFSIAVHLYLLTFFLALGLLPPYIGLKLAGSKTGSQAYLSAVFVWTILLIALWFYADRRCSSERMRFRDGFSWATASMVTGWFHLDFLVVPLGLFATFWGSVFIAFYGDCRRRPDYSRKKWHELILRYYRQRMFQ